MLGQTCHMLRFAIPVLIVLCLANPALAQDAALEDTEVTPPPAAELLAPYDPKLMRLSEVLGSIHYLRALCGTNEGSKWRDAMANMVELEEPQPKRKARMIARFNRGYRAFDASYTTCTSSARLASQRYVEEGAQLAGQINRRYGR
ncbi:putative signal peptide protein [Ahrensia sp. R2A130]|nr:putative signal peptide protein [Ahrensia sp. R2A130]